MMGRMQLVSVKRSEQVEDAGGVELEAWLALLAATPVLLPLLLPRSRG